VQFKHALLNQKSGDRCIKVRVVHNVIDMRKDVVVFPASFNFMKVGERVTGLGWGSAHDVSV
jgi:hypothetical protein